MCCFLMGVFDYCNHIHRYSYDRKGGGLFKWSGENLKEQLIYEWIVNASRTDSQFYMTVFPADWYGQLLYHRRKRCY